MFRKVNLDTQCAIFAGSVFLIFFTSSVFSIAKADPIDWYVDDNPYEMVQVYHPYSPDSDNGMKSKSPSLSGGPYANGPANPGTPSASGPNDNPTAPLLDWWQPVANFFNSILEFLGF